MKAVDDSAVIGVGPRPAALTHPARTPALFFTIRSVLDRLDNESRHPSAKRGPHTRLAALPTQTLTDGLDHAKSWLPSSDKPFGLALFRAPQGDVWVKWRQLQDDLKKEADILANCQSDFHTCGSDGAKRFVALLDQARARPDRMGQIAVVNRLVNATIRYTSDLAQYGVPDHWSAPLESFASGQGDCEDYAIAKYVALGEIGFRKADLTILLVNDANSGEDHAVLAVRQDGNWLILDNRNSMVIEDGESRHLLPLLALDDDGVKLFAAPLAVEPPGRH